MTGAMGRIGQVVFDACPSDYAFRLADILPRPNPVPPPHESVAVDFTDPDGLAELCQGVDAVVHLAGIPDADAAFDDLLPANILATTHLMKGRA